MFNQLTCIATRSGVKTTMVVGLCAAMGAAPAEAKTLYVSGATGNDSTSYAANGPSAPWRSIGRALWGSTNRAAPNSAEAARAGDVVDIACGTYDTTGPNANGFVGIALSPVNTGTASNPIRIQSSTNQPCVQVRFTSGSGSVIGTHNKSYIQWSGFDLNETNTPWDVSYGHQSAQYWQSGDEAGTTSIGNVIENSRFEGTRTSARDGDNYTTIRLHGTRGTLIRNVHVRHVGMTDENSGCVLWYFTNNITIEHSQFERCGSGIYMKGESQPVARTGFYTIRYNRFVDNHIGIVAFAGANASPSTPGLIHQNIIDGGQYGIMLNQFGGDANSNDLKFLNNIFVRQSSYCLEMRGELLANAAMLWQNNICVGSGDIAIGSDGGTTPASLQTARFLAKHNVYQNVSQTRFSTVGERVSFSNWQSTHGQDKAAPAGLITSSRLFADADFHLAAGSPALGRGRAAYGIGGPDGTPINAGPYVTGAEIIGPRVVPSPPRPHPPLQQR
jgi:hypothetical protein